MPSFAESLESAVEYDEISWKMGLERLVVAERCRGLFKDNYLLYDMAISYLEKVPHVPYRSLGINCTAYVEQKNPEKWLYERFLRPGPWSEDKPDILGMKLELLVNAGDRARLKLSFDPETINLPQEEPKEVVAINSNIDHPGPLDAKELKGFIERWPERQELVVSTLNKLLEDS